MFRTFLATAGVALLAGCAANGGSPKRAAALQSTQPVLYLSIRSAEQVYACVKPTVDNWGSVADVAGFPAEKRVDITVYEDRFPQPRQDYYLVRIEPTPGGSATRFFDNGMNHPRVPAEKVEDVLRGCTT
ncbi:Uncharacterised protein [Bordetella ansorpii]|uniref:Lipoprotein n=1 Tax=Bordetella ansorpii TaxID=288768 RepID=A0A157PKD4_9BORD|nr:hypothetical protein [Bordetella ansorpii]SAI34095.1 Uncharacterised protein [Bordetella ansorpii]